jgi:drug/metabolite transporter (DMT)-like permease
MSPVVVGAGSALLLHEPPARSTWAGLVLATAGAVVIAGADLRGGTGGRALLGDGLAFAAAVAIAGYLLLGRHARRNLPVTVYATWTYGTAAALLLTVCVLAGIDTGVGGGYDVATWLAIAGLVAGPQLLGHTVFNLVMARVSATVVAVVIIAEPVGASVLAALLLGETPSGMFWIGAPLVLTGVLLASWPRRGSAGSPVSGGGQARGARRGTPTGDRRGRGGAACRDRPTAPRRRRHPRPGCPRRWPRSRG